MQKTLNLNRSQSSRPQPARRRWWPWVLLAVVGLVLLSTTALAWSLVSLLQQSGEGWVLTIDNNDVWGAWSQELNEVWSALGPQQWHWPLHEVVTEASVGAIWAVLALTAALAVLVLCLVSVVPLLVMLVLGGVALALLLAGLAAATALAVVLAPLGLLVWLLWRVVRPAPRAAAST